MKDLLKAWHTEEICQKVLQKYKVMGKGEKINVENQY